MASKGIQEWGKGAALPLLVLGGPWSTSTSAASASFRSGAPGFKGRSEHGPCLTKLRAVSAAGMPWACLAQAAESQRQRTSNCALGCACRRSAAAHGRLRLPRARPRPPAALYPTLSCHPCLVGFSTGLTCAASRARAFGSRRCAAFTSRFPPSLSVQAGRRSLKPSAGSPPTSPSLCTCAVGRPALASRVCFGLGLGCYAAMDPPASLVQFSSPSCLLCLHGPSLSACLAAACLTHVQLNATTYARSVVTSTAQRDCPPWH